VRRLGETAVAVTGSTGLQWRGTYGDNKLRVTLTPRAPEMNPDIPLWARERVERLGTLEWKLNLDASEDQEGMKLKGELLRGQVDWREISDPSTAEILKRTASATGAPGTPIKLAYTQGPDWAIADTLVLSAKAEKTTASGTAFEYVLFAYGPRL